MEEFWRPCWTSCRLCLCPWAPSVQHTCMTSITSVYTLTRQSLNPGSCYTGHPQGPAVLRHSRHSVQNNGPRHAWGARGETDAAFEPWICAHCGSRVLKQFLCLCRASWRTLPPAVERSWRRPWNGPLLLPNLICRWVEVAYCALKVCTLSLRCCIYDHMCCMFMHSCRQPKIIILCLTFMHFPGAFYPKGKLALHLRCVYIRGW